MVKNIFLGGAIVCVMTAISFAETKKTQPLKGDGAIKARQGAMQAVGKAAKAGDFEALHMAALSARDAFRVNTTADGKIETKAKALIWSKPKGFDKIMNQMVDLAKKKDRAVFGTCKACHKTYRN